MDLRSGITKKMIINYGNGLDIECFDVSMKIKERLEESINIKHLTLKYNLSTFWLHF